MCRVYLLQRGALTTVRGERMKEGMSRTDKRVYPCLLYYESPPIATSLCVPYR